MQLIPKGGAYGSCFFGHADYIENNSDMQKVMDLLEERVADLAVDFFLGEYGNFDRFAYGCATKLKARHKNARLVFVTPYISEGYLQNHSGIKEGRFDEILYPSIENVPPRYAILRRNRWIVDKADIVITHLMRKFGGAYKAYDYAIRKKKEVYNIAVCNFTSKL